MPEGTQIRKRLPAIEKNIADIESARDIRVRIVGTIIDLSNDTLLVDDGSGKVEISFDDEQMIAGLGSGQLVRVVARVLPLIDGFALRGEVVQRFEDFDLNLYKRAREISI